MRRNLCIFGAVWTTASLTFLPAHGQTPERDFSTYRPTVKPTRIDRADAPKIDGVLDDPVWQKAAKISEFYQVEPTIGAPAVETLVYLAYSEDEIYVAVHAFDDEPENIRATVMQRDGDVWRDDMLRFYIDPFDTGLSGFGFDVNSLGARSDRLLQPNRRPINAWDIIWGSAGQRTDDGWTAEFSIPFRSINFDPEAEAWGLLLTRQRSHKNEQIRWAGIDQSFNPFNFQRSGRLVGIKDVNQGSGLEIDVQGALIGTRDWVRPRTDDYDFEPSGTLRYQFTSGLTGLVTVNTDFSDTPLDNREINTGRFSLFFPETRDFFLQDAAFFEFGGDAFNRAPNGRPFFSRRIGIVRGENVPLEGGIKLSGEFAGFEMGILSAFAEETETLEAQTLSVARVTRSVFGDDRIGFVATAGDPTGDSENSLFGVDYLFQTPSILGAGRLQADIFYQASFSDQVDDDDSYGVRVDYPNDRWSWTLEYRQIGEDFDPALGFVNRPGTNTYNARWHRRIRPNDGPLRFWQFGTEHEHVTNIDGDLETREDELKLSAETAGTDMLEFTISDVEERVDTPFFLPGGLIVPAGEYENDGVTFFLESARTRPYGLEARLQARDFFGGEAEGYEVKFLMRPNRFLDLELSYEREDISVPAGDVSVQIGSVETVVNFSPDLSVSTQTQYDNLSESLSVFGRMRWELRPQTEVFVSVAHGALIDGSDFGRNFRSIQSRSVFRIGNTFRF